IRTHMIKRGDSLTQVTETMRKKFRISARIIPSTDDQVTTTVLTNKGKMHLQEFWVKNGGRSQVRGVSFEGSAAAVPNHKALAAIRKSRTVIIAPGNPVSSIGPTLAVKEIRQTLAEKKEKVIAVSPLIGESAVSGPA